MALCTRVENSTVCCPSSSAIALPAPPSSPSEPAPGAGGTTRVSIARPESRLFDSNAGPKRSNLGAPNSANPKSKPVGGPRSDQSGEIAGEKAKENEAGEQSRRKGEKERLIYKLAKSIGPRWIPFLAEAA